MNNRTTITLALTLLLTTVLATEPAAAFLPSPTTPKTRTAPSNGIEAKAVAPELAARVLADPQLGRGIERIVATPDGKRLSSLFGRLSTPVRGTPEEIARNFLLRHAAVFNIPTTRGPARLETVKTVRAAKGSHVFFRMLFDTLPVLGGNISVHLTGGGEIVLCNGSLPTIDAVRNRPTLDEKAAVTQARTLIGERESRGKASARLVISCRDGEARHAWEVSLPASEPLGDWVVLLDAASGAELQRRNDLFFFSGSGLAYLNHPLVGEPTRVELPYLSRNDLAGDYCYAVNGKGPAATSSTNIYDFTPGHTHFDEVNVFYHVNRVHDFFGKFGFKNLDFPIWATVHFRHEYDNAFYSPKEKKMYFGDGYLFNDFAKEEAIIYHEYSHAVLNEIVVINNMEEGGAIHEGQADYFACSLASEPVLGEWLSAKTDATCARDMRNSFHYPENIEHEVHADGRIWGGALWDIRTALGADVSDELIFSSFYNLKPENPTFADAANAILAADLSVFEGKYQETVTGIFAKRGILSGSAAAAVLDGRDLERARTFDLFHGE